MTTKPSDDLGPLVPLVPADAAGGSLLSSAAGWNQTLDDWHWHLSVGHGFGIRTTAGRLVATVVALPYPQNFGWISMVLVDESYRRRGLARASLRAAIDHLLAAKLVPMLDATPAGKLVYTDLGFREIDTLTRWRGTGATEGTIISPPTDLSPFFPLDRRAFGADRSHLLAALAHRSGSAVIAESGGYAVVRPGRIASHIGPVVTASPDLAVHLVSKAITQTRGALVIDVRDSCHSMADMLSEHRFVPERSLTRMAYGRTAGYGDATLVSAIAGPDLG